MNIFNWFSENKQEGIGEGIEHIEDFKEDYKEDYNNVVKEIKTTMFPDMNIFYNYYQEFSFVLEQFDEIFFPDFNIYSLIFNEVLEELLTEYKERVYYPLQKCEYLENFKTCFWQFKYSKVMYDLKDSIWQYDKIDCIEKQWQKEMNEKFRKQKMRKMVDDACKMLSESL